MVLKEVIAEVNKDIPHQKQDHLKQLTSKNEKEWMKELYLIRRRRFDELVEFDKRILEEDRKWQYYERDPSGWKQNVVVAAAALAGAGAMAADAMEGDEVLEAEGEQEDYEYD